MFFSRVLRLLGVLVAFCAPLCAQTPAPKPVKPVAVVQRQVTAAQYRAFLIQQLRRLARANQRAPRDVRGILKSLQTPFLVRRADGATQATKHQFWVETANFKTNTQNLPRLQLLDLQRDLQRQIAALNDWNRAREGVYFAPADAKTIVSQLESSGQIRTGPHAWQQAIANARQWLGDTWSAFIKWLEGLFPRPAPRANVNAPEMSWLWPVFWVIITGFLLVILFFIFRALGGAQWLASRRRPTKSIEFHGEDALLLKLPADELRERARHFAAQENFREALRHRFLAVLVFFDARGVWNYDIRRTNWEHTAALRKSEIHRPLVAPLSSLTRRFDRVRYGGAPCDAHEWDVFQNDAQSLENQVPGANSTERSRKREEVTV